MAYTIGEILGNLDERILERGEDYYHSGRIESLRRLPDDSIEALVEGSEDFPYHVHVCLDNESCVIQADCDCPYDYGPYCKHLAAVFLAMENGDITKSQKAEADTPSLRSLIDSLSQEQLRAFVLETAQEDQHLRRELWLRFGQPRPEQELLDATKAIEAAVDRRSRGGYMDWRDFDAICGLLEEQLDHAQRRMSQGHLLLAFRLSLLILRETMIVVSMAEGDPDRGYEIRSDAFGLLETVCQEALTARQEELCDSLYSLLLEESANQAYSEWPEEQESFLLHAARLVTSKNAAKLEQTLGALADKYQKRGYPQDSAGSIRLEMIRSLEGEEAAHAFLMENLDNDVFRAMAIDKALEAKDFPTAERLCIAKVEAEDESYGHRYPSQWKRLLYRIYEQSGNLPKQTEIARNLFLRNEESYYGLLKELMQKQGLWEAEWPRLRQECHEQLPTEVYMRILAKENEGPLLMEQVELRPSAVFIYGEYLAKRFPEKVFDLYETEIFRLAGEATDRSRYALVCDRIKSLYGLGGKQEALRLIETLRQLYRRRPALQDELNTLMTKLDKMDGRRNDHRRPGPG